MGKNAASISTLRTLYDLAKWVKPEKLPEARSEDELQVMCYAWLANKAPWPARLAYHPMQEGKRSRGARAVAALSGLTSGVPDIVIPAPSGGYGHLYIELKHGNNTPTENQLQFLRLMNEAGNAAVWYRGDVRGFTWIVLNYLNETLPTPYLDRPFEAPEPWGMREPE